MTTEELARIKRELAAYRNLPEPPAPRLTVRQRMFLRDLRRCIALADAARSTR